MSNPYKPSAYMPFSRWFTNERQRELDEARALYAYVKAQENTLTNDVETLAEIILWSYKKLPDGIREHFSDVQDVLLQREPILQPISPPAFERMSLQEFVNYRNLLQAKQYYYANKAAMLELIEEQGIASAFYVISSNLPALTSPSPFTIPLIYALHEPRRVVEHILAVFQQSELLERGLFLALSWSMYENMCAVSGRRTDDHRTDKPLKQPGDSTTPLDTMVDQYLRGTPFAKLLMTPVPLKLTHEDRYNHMHVVGGTGAGKTTLIENLILHDLGSPDPPSLVLIDPHGDLIKKLVRADLDIADRLIVIDPRDIEHPPAVNVFAMDQGRMGSYDEAMREQITAGVIETFDYLFTGLLGADLTAKQGVFFRYIARLMLMLPQAEGHNANILDIMRLMSDTTPYKRAIDLLDDIPRDFFLNDFAGSSYKQTRDQVRYRLQAIIENPTLARLFTTRDTKIDLFTEMNRGAIILIDTAKDFLKGASGNFGRIFISLVLQAVLERAAIPDGKRKPTFLIVDEAASYFDSNMDDLLTDARKYRCGCLFAHQYLEQASSSLRASLAANTGIKFASGLSSRDARSMAPDMRTTDDFILGQPSLQFAAHIRNVTPNAVSIPVSVGAFDRLRKRSPSSYELLLMRNQERVSFGRNGKPAATQPPPPAPNSSSPQPDDGDYSREWHNN